jgi:hypothetical protein
MRVLRLAVLLSLSTVAIAAQAQTPITTRVLTKDVRLGTYTTASVTLPAWAESLHIQGVMTAAEASDPANEVVITVFASRDRATWIEIDREYWQGGTFVPKGQTQSQPNYIDVAFGGITTYALGDVRAEVDVRTKTTVGLDITVMPFHGGLH